MLILRKRMYPSVSSVVLDFKVWFCINPLHHNIGGIDKDGNRIIVEVDESKFGKRKNHRGHAVEGVWVVGGVEHTPERKIFVTTVEDRKKDTLHLILSNYIKEGSEIRTDCWKGYCGLSRIPGKRYRHRTVNHAKEFKTAAGVHTNTIEGIFVSSYYSFCA